MQVFYFVIILFLFCFVGNLTRLRLRPFKAQRSNLERFSIPTASPPRSLNGLFVHFLLYFFLCMFSVEWGWRSGESAGFPPMQPGFNSGRVSYVGRLCCWFWPCSESFSLGSLIFCLL